jgi:DNA polymerase-3 subunit beta
MKWFVDSPFKTSIFALYGVISFGIPMKFTVALPDLQKALQKVLPAIPAKSTIPVLEHLHAELEGSQLTFTATDQEITISLAIAVVGEKDGALLIPARQFNDLVKELGSSGSIEVDGNPKTQVITIRTPTGSYEMKSLDAEEFPSIPPFPDAQVAQLRKEDMVRMANKTVFAVSTEEYRPSMTGVFFQFHGESVTAVATDGFRLSRVVVQANGASFPADLEAIVPSRAVELLRKLDSNVEMAISRTHARFSVGSMTITTRIIDEKYPPYQNVIPSDNDKTLIVNQREVLSAIKRVSLFANTNTKHVRFRIEASSMSVHSEDEDSGGKGTETIPCEFTSGSFEVGFNYRFLEEAIKNITADDDPDLNVKMTFSSPIRAVLITPAAGDDSLLMLVMPVKI